MTALAAGSISVGLYRRSDLSPEAALVDVLEEAKLAESAGFDGVTFSEHHLGFREYFPNPLLIAAFVLEQTRTVWSGPLPMLLTLRPAAIVAEDLAWLAARHPGRVAVGLASGNRPEEHALHEATSVGVTALFDRGLRVLAEALGTYGDARVSALSGDPAVRDLRGLLPIVSAGRSRVAVRRAATYGFGLLLSPLSAPAEMRRLADEYVRAGGTGRRVLIYSACVSRDGAPPDDLGAKADWTAAGSVGAVIERLVAVIHESGADALNLRFVRRGNDPDGDRRQIASLGEGEHLSMLRAALRSTRAPDAPAARPTVGTGR